MTDISALTIEELRMLQKDADILIVQKQEQSILDAYDQIHEIASSVGFTVLDLLQEGQKRHKKTSRKPVLPRYRNIKNEAETWSGRGRQPLWLVAEIEAGAKLEDFLI